MNETKPRFEHEPDLEQVMATLREFARQLGFVPTAEMDSLASHISPENENEIIPRWHLLAEAEVERCRPGMDHLRAQAGLLIEQLRINLKGRNIRYVLNSLNDIMDLLDRYDLSDMADYLNELGYKLQDKIKGAP